MFHSRQTGKLKADIAKSNKGVIWQLMNVVNVKCQLMRLVENVTHH
jgi:hypothetical protein